MKIKRPWKDIKLPLNNMGNRSIGTGIYPWDVEDNNSTERHMFYQTSFQSNQNQK